MTLKRCNFCGGTHYDIKKTDYLYSYKGNYLLVPDTPVEVCGECGMLYYDAAVLKHIEARFFAIQNQQMQPDCYFEIPKITFEHAYAERSSAEMW